MPKCFVCHGGQLIRTDDKEVCDKCGYSRKARPHNTEFQSIRRGALPVRIEQVTRLATLMGWDSRPMALGKLAHRPLTATQVKEIADRIEGVSHE